MADASLIEAAKAGDVALLRKLLDNGADLEEKDGWGNTAFIWATAGGHAPAVRLLIDEGADLSVLADGKKTASDCARGNGHPSVADMIDAAVQQPRKPPGKPEKWVAAGESAVAFVSLYPGLKRRITQLFNFETRQQVLLSENLETSAEAMAAPTSFDDLPPRVLEKALEAFQGFGGKPDRDYVLAGADSIGKNRKMPAPGGGHG